MLSILGRIILGEFELGVVSTATPPALFTATANPTASLTISGGTPLRSFTSVLGTIPLGKFEPGQTNPVNSQVLLGKGNFQAMANPIAIFAAQTTLAAVFTATAEPTLVIGTGGSFVASADPRMSILMIVLPSFVATASPQFRVFVSDVQQQEDLVSGPLKRSIKAQNFVY